MYVAQQWELGQLRHGTTIAPGNPTSVITSNWYKTLLYIVHF